MYGTDLNTALPFLLFAFVATYSSFGMKRETLEGAGANENGEDLVRMGN